MVLQQIMRHNFARGEDGRVYKILKTLYFNTFMLSVIILENFLYKTLIDSQIGFPFGDQEAVLKKKNLYLPLCFNIHKSGNLHS